MTKLFFGILIVLMTGCSSLTGVGESNQRLLNKPKIHLYLYSGFDSTPEQYITAFAEKGYEVELRHGELPANEEKSFIIHSPSMLNPKHDLDVANVISILNDAGIVEINQYQYFLGKHSYTPGNVGIYLL